MTTITQDGLTIPDGEAQVFSVYRNVETSEVSGSERTLSGALSLHEATPNAEIVCNGLAFAIAVCLDSTEWVLTGEGKRQLRTEHKRLLDRWRK